MTITEFLALSPITFLTMFALVVLCIEALSRNGERGSYVLSIVGTSVSAVFSLLSLDLTGTVCNGMVTIGGVGYLFCTLFSVAALFSIILSRSYLRGAGAGFGEFYLLIMFAAIGMMLMATAADLIMIFLGLELMSVCLYILAGFTRTRRVSNESSLKYFLLGAFATGFLLYGIALLYGASGTTSLAGLASKYQSLVTSPLFWIGSGLLLIGLAFKVGAVPFHMWVPDVYEGAPTPASGFMATGAKAAAFSAILLFFTRNDFASAEKIRLILVLLSAASMILGNLIAIAQTSIKRMLAYSSIAHAGYMLAGIAAANQTGRSGVMFYLISYTFMNLGAFGILSVFESGEGEKVTFDDYAGLGTSRPYYAALMSVFMLSLAGIPPFAGFFGKYYVFLAAVQSNLTWLAILGVLMSVVSVYYYLRVIMSMYFRKQEGEPLQVFGRTRLAVLTVAALLVIEIGLLPSGVLSILTTLY
ncbi:MAG TPA: NADH-quinone oxidoreductase subunit N [Bacteroidota bacterium]|nr:NADH-quinone oxidoreductase subunit N [Bacteroidota bacterium]